MSASRFGFPPAPRSSSRVCCRSGNQRLASSSSFVDLHRRCAMSSATPSTARAMPSASGSMPTTRAREDLNRHRKSPTRRNGAYWNFVYSVPTLAANSCRTRAPNCSTSARSSSAGLWSDLERRNAAASVSYRQAHILIGNLKSSSIALFSC